MLPEVAFSQRQRLQFIESIAFWEGSIDRPRVARVFGVSENHITKDFGLYRERFPGNLDYDLSKRSYRPGKKFKQRFSSGSAEEYLALLRASHEGIASTLVSTIGEGVLAELLPIPMGKVNAAVLKEITRALHCGMGVRVVYQSLQTLDTTQREVWPHALVFAGSRWHVRVFDSRYEDFIDLVLQRILGIQPTLNPAPKSAALDEKWNRRMTVSIQPRPELPPLQQEVIALEFGMEKIENEWRWVGKIRECLVPYFLEAMALGRLVAHLHPKLKLVEQEILETHAFPAFIEVRKSFSKK